MNGAIVGGPMGAPVGGATAKILANYNRARQIVDQFPYRPNGYPNMVDFHVDREKMVSLIASALSVDRNRCARIVVAHPSNHQCEMKDSCADEIAADIREGR